MWHERSTMTEMRDLEINGHKVPVTIEVLTDHDEIDIGNLVDGIAFPDEEKKLIDDLEKQRCDVLVVKVKVTSKELDYVEGSDVLGGVIVYNRNDLINVINDNGMIQNAIDDYCNNVRNEYESAIKKKEYLEKFV